MKKILITSHGSLASGVKSVAKILLRDDSAITAIDCYLDDSDFSQRIQMWMDDVDPGDDAIIFTDLLGGSVCSKVVAMHPERRDIQHVTGFNLAVVLECLLTPTSLTAERVDEIVTTASRLMKRLVIEASPKDPAPDEDEEFFA